MRSRRFYICMIFLALLTACQENTMIFLPNPTIKVVLNSMLIANQSPIVYVGKTWAVTETIPTKTYYENAQVQLWEDEVFVGTLVFKNGVYELPSYLIKPEKTYIIRAEVPNIGKVESNPTKTPPNINISDLITDFNFKWTTREIELKKPALIKFRLQDNAPKGYYYVTSAVALSKGKKIEFNPLTTENLEISSSSLDFSSNKCYSLFPELSGIRSKRSIGYNNQCFASSEKEIGLVLDQIGRVENGNVNTNADEIKIYIAIYSAEYLQFAQAAKAIEGADNAFIETKPTYSNVKGGIGFVTAINITENVIKIP